MTQYLQTEELSCLTLGKTIAYNSDYDPSLLQGVSRRLGREGLKLENALPFSGVDLWTLYELSWLNANGLPQVAIGEVRIPDSTPKLIESKSFKLYLNSLNQTRFTSWQQVTDTLIQDLSQAAGGPVSVQLFPLKHFTNTPVVAFDGVNIDQQNITIDSFDFDPQILHGAATGPTVTEKLHSDLLKSNCLITNQPDWGSICISYTGKQINKEKLLRYIVSFRMHSEFHEQCVERIFSDILHFCKPDLLTVYARYTRRGGLEINPYRTNKNSQPQQNLRLARQ
ncbi:MAG: NADPH-dependent 7-cyano-7-deazaguanine reductase QueF [Vibrionaceae bacterium]